ncbi:hypothetical protein EV121DRAFT_297191 [Schizophyllum commune]
MLCSGHSASLHRLSPPALDSPSACRIHQGTCILCSSAASIVIDALLSASPPALDVSPSAIDISPSAIDISPSAIDISPSAIDISPSAIDISPFALIISPFALIIWSDATVVARRDGGGPTQRWWPDATVVPPPGPQHGCRGRG